MTTARLYRAGVESTYEPPPIAVTAYTSSMRAIVQFNGDELRAPIGSFLNLGYGNLYGGYTLTDKNWGSRADQSASLVSDLQVSIFAALELHEENDMHLDFLRRLRLIDTGWALAEGDGGNHLLYFPDLWQILSSTSLMMPGNRSMTHFAVRDKTTQVVSNLLVAHFRANDTNGTSRATERAQEASFLAQYAAPLRNVIILADLNSSTTSAGFPRAILAAAGFRGLREASTDGVVNGNIGTYDGQVGGPWIEDILVRPEAEVSFAALTLTNGVSDHAGWLSAQVAVEQVIDSGIKLTLYRESGGKRILVPGIKNLPALTGVFADNTVPLNRSVQYVAVLSNGDEYVSEPVVVEAPLPLLTHPVSGNVAQCWVETWPELTYEATTTLVKVPGRRSPVVITSGEYLPTSNPQLITRTEKQRADLESLAVPGEVLLLRTTDPRMPDAFIAITARSTERVMEFKLSSLTRRHKLTVQEIAAEDMTERGIGNTLGDLARAIPNGTLGDLAARFPGGTLLDVASTDWKALAV